jgi:hypothetical protein
VVPRGAPYSKSTILPKAVVRSTIGVLRERGDGMGSATQRKLAALGPHNKPTVRAMEPITRVVAESQILDVAPAAPSLRLVAKARRQSATLNDHLALDFFEKGNQQEASGVYIESEHVRVSSLDRVPRRWWPMLLVFCLFTAAAAAGAWWVGLRPPAEWQSSPTWQALHLPPMPSPVHPRWKL